MYYVNEESDDVKVVPLKQHNIQSTPETTPTMATLLAPVSFCEKRNIPICNLLKGTEGLARNTHDSHIVLTLPITLVGVDDPCFRQNLGILVTIKTEPAA